MDMMSKDEYANHNRAHGEIDALMTGTTVSDVLTYYPIETVQMYHKGSEEHAGVYSDQEIACWNSVKNLTVDFANAKVSYDYIDFNLLSKCKVVDGKIVTDRGRTYNAIVFPVAEYTKELTEVIEKLVKDGAVVKGVKNQLFSAIDFIDLYDTEKELIANLDRTNFAVSYSEDNGRLAVLARDTDSGRAYMLVNCDKEDKEVNLTIAGIDNPKLYCPLLGKEIDAKITKEGKGVNLKFTIRDRDTIIIK